MPKFIKGVSRVRTKGVWRDVEMKKPFKTDDTKTDNVKPDAKDTNNVKPPHTKQHKDSK